MAWKEPSLLAFVALVAFVAFVGRWWAACGSLRDGRLASAEAQPSKAGVRGTIFLSKKKKCPARLERQSAGSQPASQPPQPTATATVSQSASRRKSVKIFDDVASAASEFIDAHLHCHTHSLTHSLTHPAAVRCAVLRYAASSSISSIFVRRFMRFFRFLDVSWSHCPFSGRFHSHAHLVRQKIDAERVSLKPHLFVPRFSRLKNQNPCKVQLLEVSTTMTFHVSEWRKEPRLDTTHTTHCHCHAKSVRL